MLVEDVRRIAVLRASGIGDYIVCLPALDAVRKAYPQAEVMLLGQRWHASFLTGRPGPVDRVVPLPRIPGVTASEGATAEPSRIRRFLTWLRGQRLDLAIQLHGGGRYSNPLIRQSGAGLTAGLRAPDAEPLDRWVRYTHYQHEVVRFLESVALVGAAPVGLSPRVAVTDHDRFELSRLEPLPERLVAVHPGARDPRRRWPLQRLAAVADGLAASGYQIVVTAAATERPIASELLEHMRQPAGNLAGRLSLGGLAALFERCSLMVGNDSGPRHLAEAVGAPTVSVYWCGNLLNAGPLVRARHRPLTSWTTRCPECGIDCVRADADAVRCDHTVSFVADVTVDQVLDAARDLLVTIDGEPAATGQADGPGGLDRVSGS